MKTFKNYLAESRRDYKYRIKLAFKPTDELMDEIEKALARYDLVSISKPKSLPIQKQDSDFQGINFPETYFIDVVVAYPANYDSIRHTLTQVNMDLELVNVVSTDHDDSVKKEEEAISQNSEDGAILNKEYKKDDNAAITADNFGSDYNDKLIKNSLTKAITVPTPPAPAETTNDLPQGKLSAVGSKQNKIPHPKSYTR